jgi:hypothetical protein
LVSQPLLSIGGPVTDECVGGAHVLVFQGEFHFRRQVVGFNDLEIELTMPLLRQTDEYVIPSGTIGLAD